MVYSHTAKPPKKGTGAKLKWGAENNSKCRVQNKALFFALVI